MRSHTFHTSAATAVALAYAGLIARSRWQGDEYLDFALLRDLGRQFEIYRLLHWAPRPWSEALLMIYGSAVIHWHRPLSGSFAAMLWALLAAACLAPALASPDPTGRPQRVLLGATMFALCLVGHPVTEVFYWPAGSVAYIPTLAAAALLFWWLLDGVDDSLPRKLAASATLVLAAGCSEVGLFLTLAFTGCAILGSVRQGVLRLWWLVPGLAVSAVLADLLLRGRVGAAEMAGTAHTLHDAGASLRAAIVPFLRDLVAGNEESVGLPDMVQTSICRALILVGARWSLPVRPTDARRAGAHLPALAAALLLAAFGTLAAAYYQFGAPCCQRHETMRECFITLALICVGAWSASRAPRAAPHPAAAIALSAAILIPFAGSIGGIIEAYRLYPAAIRARTETWQSGLQTGSDVVVLVRGPNGSLIYGGDFTPPGTYVLTPDTLWYNKGVMEFFDKKVLRVVEPP